MNHLNGLYESNAIDESYANEMEAQLAYDEQETRERRAEMEPTPDHPQMKTITVRRISTAPGIQWVAHLHDDNSGTGYYGNTAAEAEVKLRTLENCKGIKATIIDTPLDQIRPIGEHQWAKTKNYAQKWTDGSTVVIDCSGMIVTDPITEPSRPLYGDDKCCSDCFSPSQDVDTDNGPMAMPESCIGDDCPCHDLVRCKPCSGTGLLPGTNYVTVSKAGPPVCYHCNGTGKPRAPKVVEKLIAASVGMLLLIAIGAAAGVK